MFRWIRWMVSRGRSGKAPRRSGPPTLIGPLLVLIFLGLLGYFVYMRLHGQS